MCLARNPRLVYGRMTGWGQEGPLADRPGHDVNYLARHRVAARHRPAGERPVAAVEPARRLRRRRDAAGVRRRRGPAGGVAVGPRAGGRRRDGGRRGAARRGLPRPGGQTGMWHDRAGGRTGSTAAPRSTAPTETADARFVAVGANEPKFYRVLVDALGLSLDELPAAGPGELAGTSASGSPAIFRTRTRDEWATLFAPLETVRHPGAHPRRGAPTTRPPWPATPSYPSTGCCRPRPRRGSGAPPGPSAAPRPARGAHHGGLARVGFRRRRDRRTRGPAGDRGADMTAPLDGITVLSPRAGDRGPAVHAPPRRPRRPGDQGGEPGCGRHRPALRRRGARLRRPLRLAQPRQGVGGARTWPNRPTPRCSPACSAGPTCWSATWRRARSAASASPRPTWPSGTPG